jgi:hypothetical protein
MLKNEKVKVKNNTLKSGTDFLLLNTLGERTKDSTHDAQQPQVFNNYVIMNRGLEANRILKVGGGYGDGPAVYTITEYARTGRDETGFYDDTISNNAGISIPRDNTTDGSAMVRLRLFGLTTVVIEYQMSVDINGGELQGELITVAECDHPTFQIRVNKFTLESRHFITLEFTVPYTGLRHELQPAYYEITVNRAHTDVLPVWGE